MSRAVFARRWGKFIGSGTPAASVPFALSCGCGRADSSHAPRFLVVRGGAIGDFIVTLPVLQALRAQWPHAVIEIWGYPHIAQLAVAGGWADSVVSLDRADMARFFVPNPEFSESQVATIRSFDLIFNYLHDAVGQVRSNFLLAGARQVISGSPIIKAGHAIPFLLEPLQALAIYETELVPELDLSGEARAEARRHLRQLGLKGRPVAIHPGSGGVSKKWPLAHFVANDSSMLGSGPGSGGDCG